MEKFQICTIALLLVVSPLLVAAGKIQKIRMIYCSPYNVLSRFFVLNATIMILQLISLECPDDFVENDGKCYGMPTRQSMTWYQAKTRCCQLGESYDLLVLETENEYEFIKESIKSNLDGISVWIGLRETPARDTFEWNDGSSLSYGSTFYRYPWAIYSPFDKEPNSVSRLCYYRRRKEKMRSIK